MAKLIDSIAKLMQSRNYPVKGSSANSQVSKYFNARYPGEMRKDETGRYISDDKEIIDEAAFRKIKDEIETNNEELKDSVQEFYDYIDEKYDGEISIDIDIESDAEYFYVADMFGNIRKEEVEVLSCEFPDDDDLPQSKFVWHCEGDNSCDECLALDETTYYFPEDIPARPHPNRQCAIEEVPLDYRPQQKTRAKTNQKIKRIMK